MSHASSNTRASAFIRVKCLQSRYMEFVHGTGRCRRCMRTAETGSKSLYASNCNTCECLMTMQLALEVWLTAGKKCRGVLHTKLCLYKVSPQSQLPECSAFLAVQRFPSSRHPSCLFQSLLPTHPGPLSQPFLLLASHHSGLASTATATTQVIRHAHTALLFGNLRSMHAYGKDNVMSAFQVHKSKLKHYD